MPKQDSVLHRIEAVLASQKTAPKEEEEKKVELSKHELKQIQQHEARMDQIKQV